MAIFQHPSSEPDGPPAPCLSSGPCTQGAELGPEAGTPDTAPDSDPLPATPPVGSPGGKAGNGMIELQLFVSLFLAALCKWLHPTSHREGVSVLITG